MGSHTLFSPLLQHLHDRGMFLFSHVVSHRVSYPHIQSWQQAEDIELTGSLATKWDLYIRQVEDTGIYLNEETDKMTWVGNTFQSQIAVHDIYKHITNPRTSVEVPNWLHNIWRQELPLKLKCFR